MQGVLQLIGPTAALRGHIERPAVHPPQCLMIHGPDGMHLYFHPAGTAPLEARPMVMMQLARMMLPMSLHGCCIPAASGRFGVAETFAFLVYAIQAKTTGHLAALSGSLSLPLLKKFLLWG